jgi:hypothetical protein
MDDLLKRLAALKGQAGGELPPSPAAEVAAPPTAPPPPPHPAEIVPQAVVDPETVQQQFEKFKLAMVTECTVKVDLHVRIEGYWRKLRQCWTQVETYGPHPRAIE